MGNNGCINKFKYFKYLAEYIDGTNLEARLWPRASAVAERLNIGMTFIAF
jgi:hypothetical protein